MSENDPNADANQPDGDTPDTREGAVDTAEQRQQAREQADGMPDDGVAAAAADAQDAQNGQDVPQGDDGRHSPQGRRPQQQPAQGSQHSPQQPAQQPSQQGGTGMGAGAPMADPNQRETGADRSGELVTMEEFFGRGEGPPPQQQGGQPQQGQQPVQQPPEQPRQQRPPTDREGTQAADTRAQQRAHEGRNRQQGQQPQQQRGQQPQQPQQGQQPPGSPQHGQQQQQQQGGQQPPQGNPPDMPDEVRDQNRVDTRKQRQNVMSEGESFSFVYGAGGRETSFTVNEPQGDAVYDAQDVQAAIPDSYTDHMAEQVRQYGSLEAYQEAAMAGEADVRTPVLDGDGLRSVHELLVGVMDHNPTGGQQELAGPQLRQWLQTGFPLGLATIVAIRTIGMLPNMGDVETFRLND